MEKSLNNLSKQELIELLFMEDQRNQSVIKKKENLIEQKENLIEQKSALISQLQRMLFGAKSERFIKAPVDASQLSLSFEELTQSNNEEADAKHQDLKEKISYTREKKKHPGRNKLPDTLVEKEIIIEPEESTVGLVKIGEERTEILELTPAKFFKLIIVRPKYAKPENQGMLIGELPSRPIEKCLAGNALLSSIIVNKYVDHLPLYRQQQIFKRADIVIAPSTIDGWVSQLGHLLEPLYQAMKRSVKNAAYLQADETPTRVLDKNKKGKTHRGFYWVYHSPLKKMVVFDYQKGRNKDAPRSMLEEFEGYLQTDGYAVYNQYHKKEKVTHLACWAHARRYFEKALEQDKIRAEYAMLKIQQLYAIEREIIDSSTDLKKKERLKKSLPIINELGKWISEENKKVLPKSLIGKAFMYTINLWDSLQNYLYSGELQIDNNLIENSIRPNALGRKNYLFAGSHIGAQRTAMFYTFMGTCKMNNVEPLKWMKFVLDNIADHKANRLWELFPQNIEV